MTSAEPIKMIAAEPIEQATFLETADEGAQQ